MCAHVILNLLNELGKRDKMRRACGTLMFLFHNLRTVINQKRYEQYAI